MIAPIVFARRPLTIESLLNVRQLLLLDPHYQRQGDVWSSERQGQFIDSLMNGFIVPAMYWHELGPSSPYTKTGKRYSVVDGRQRLEALFAFVDGEIALGSDFVLMEDTQLELIGHTLARIQETAPWLYARFMRTELDIVVISTEEIDLVEELFSRLNDGVPLSAAEKRNRGPILPPLVEGLVGNHAFFTSRLPFGNKRYRQFDLLAKFMRIENRGLTKGRLPDLRKTDLDRDFDSFRPQPNAQFDEAGKRAEAVSLLGRVASRLDRIAALFVEHDPLLSSVGMVTLFYAVDRVLEDHAIPQLTRPEIEGFEAMRIGVEGKETSQLSEKELLTVEFGNYAQGPNSGSYLTRRLEILLNVIRDLELPLNNA